MSKMSEAILSCQEMAHDMGDDFGFDPETAQIISKALGYPVEFVQQAIDIQEEECEIE